MTFGNWEVRILASGAADPGRRSDKRTYLVTLAQPFGVIFLPPQRGTHAVSSGHDFNLSLISRGTVALMAVSVTAAPAQAGEWKQLFDGKDLVGWKHVGPGEMTVEDGLIRTHGGMGLLYWTGGKLGDCVIRVVYKMRDHNDNSGVYIRIPIEPREAWMPVHYGYEVQIDNDPKSRTKTTTTSLARFIP